MVRLKFRVEKCSRTLKMFQFQMVRLKSGFGESDNENVVEFQFQMVRLKCFSPVFNSRANVFQFQMVRLK